MGVFRGRFAPRPFGRYVEGLLREKETARRSGFHLASDLVIDPHPDLIHLSESIFCLGGITVKFDERLRFLRERWRIRRSDDHARVGLIWYSYNVSVGRGGTVFRYDSPDTDVGRNAAPHHSFHHRHRFDAFGTWNEIAPPRQVQERDVPTLRQVLREAEQWYWDNQERLSKARGERV